jgi:hypothetical protein
MGKNSIIGTWIGIFVFHSNHTRQPGACSQNRSKRRRCGPRRCQRRCYSPLQLNQRSTREAGASPSGKNERHLVFAVEVCRKTHGSRTVPSSKTPSGAGRQ